MIVAALLALLAVFDGVLSGFRAAAGRDGRIDKRPYYRRAIARGAQAGVVVVVANVAVAAVLVATSADPGATWAEFLRAGTTCAWIFGGFATVTLAAIALWWSPIHEYRLLATVIVLGPLTLIRPIVIIAGLAIAAARAGDPRVWIMAALAGTTVLGVEGLLGRAHVARWRQLVEDSVSARPEKLAIAAFAKEHAGTDLDLDRDLEAAEIEVDLDS